MTITLLFFTALIFFLAEIVCDGMIVLQSRLRIAGFMMCGFLAVWVFAEILSGQTPLWPTMDAMLPWGMIPIEK